MISADVNFDERWKWKSESQAEWAWRQEWNQIKLMQPGRLSENRIQVVSQILF